VPRESVLSRLGNMTLPPLQEDLGSYIFSLLSPFLSDQARLDYAPHLDKNFSLNQYLRQSRDLGITPRIPDCFKPVPDPRSGLQVLPGELRRAQSNYPEVQVPQVSELTSVTSKIVTYELPTVQGRPAPFAIRATLPSSSEEATPSLDLVGIATFMPLRVTVCPGSSLIHRLTSTRVLEVYGPSGCLHSKVFLSESFRPRGVSPRALGGDSYQFSSSSFSLKYAQKYYVQLV